MFDFDIADIKWKISEKRPLTKEDNIKIIEREIIKKIKETINIKNNEIIFIDCEIMEMNIRFSFFHDCRYSNWELGSWMPPVHLVNVDEKIKDCIHEAKKQLKNYTLLNILKYPKIVCLILDDGDIGVHSLQDAIFGKWQTTCSGDKVIFNAPQGFRINEFNKFSDNFLTAIIGYYYNNKGKYSSIIFENKLSEYKLPEKLLQNVSSHIIYDGERLVEHKMDSKDI